MTKFTSKVGAVLVGASLSFLCSSAPESAGKIKFKPWSQQKLTAIQRSALEAFHGPDLRSKAGPMRKVGYELTQQFYRDLLSPPASTAKLKAHDLANLLLRESADGRQLVLVDATATGDARVLAVHLRQLGATDVSVYPPVVSGWVPVKALDQIATIESLKFLRPSRPYTRTGAVTSQGDFAMRGPSVRPPASPNGPTGSGIAVGAISDSFNCLGGAAADIANGEFPNGVTVIREIPDCIGGSGTDEGRAMLQIVADVAPDSSLLFASGVGGIAAFANSVASLASGGAKVIVDDLVYFNSPWFQDGVINAAVNDAVLSMEATYFSAAGNQAANSFEAPFRLSTTTGVNGGIVHDFDPLAGTERVFSSIFIPTGATATIFMQWDQPAASACPGCPGSQSDLDIYFFDGQVIGQPGFDLNIDGDPFEAAAFTNSGPPGLFFFVIENFSGPNPGLVKLIYLNGNLSYEDHTSSSTAVGPGSAANGIAVGAAEFYQTPACDTSPPQLSSFSSRGGAPIQFSTSGARLSTAVIRQKPEIVAPQAGNTTFFGQDIPDQPGSSTRGECLDGDALPNFFGTSAAAPHAAGVAALLLDAFPSLTSQQVYDGMKSSAVDMLGVGFDFDSGFGLLQADAALQEFVDTTPDAFSFTSQTGINPSAQVTSNTVTIVGINAGAPISVSGGEYSITCNGSFTAAAGTIESNESVCVRHAASGVFNTATTTTLTVGDIDGTFASTTRAADTAPNAFTFTNQTGVAPSAVVTSNAITISGIEAAAQVSIAVGQYSIGCGGTFTSNTGTISNGQTVCVRLAASPAFSTASTATLNVGGVTGSFSATTRAAAPANRGGGGGGSIGLTSLVPLLLLLRRRKHLTRT